MGFPLQVMVDIASKQFFCFTWVDDVFPSLQLEPVPSGLHLLTPHHHQVCLVFIYDQLVGDHVLLLYLLLRTASLGPGGCKYMFHHLHSLLDHPMDYSVSLAASSRKEISHVDHGWHMGGHLYKTYTVVVLVLNLEGPHSAVYG